MNLVSLFHCDMLLKVLLYSTKLSMNYKFIIKKASQSITSYELYMVESKGFAPLGRLKKNQNPNISKKCQLHYPHLHLLIFLLSL